MSTFNEVQRFRVRWAWAAVLALNVLFIIAIVKQVILGEPFGARPAPNAMLIVVEIFFLLLLIFLRSVKLYTAYNISGIQYRFFPFQFKTTSIEWHELSDAYIREYNSFFEYGGWGIRTGSPKTGKAINTPDSSRQGLQLRFRNGQLLLIGTRDPAAVQKILDEVIISGKINRIV